VSYLKVCGTTQIDDALFCDQLRVDFLGFIFHPDSPRFIDYKAAAKIIKILEYAKPVGVFVNQSAAEIERISSDLNLWGAQIYQDHVFEKVQFKVIRAHRVRGAEPIPPLNGESGDYILLDAYHDAHYGGTGQSFDWRSLPQDLAKVFLAGGINISNVDQVKALQPFAIDLVSGVESSPGRKDFAKLEALVQRLRS
jgi:phosphoribosylanthranilate isomerase